VIEIGSAIENQNQWFCPQTLKFHDQKSKGSHMSSVIEEARWSAIGKQCKLDRTSSTFFNCEEASVGCYVCLHITRANTIDAE